MHFQDDEVIGIVGGMGPEAGIALFNRILKTTDAKTDQEHLSVILMSLPKHLPDRTRFLQGEIPTNPAHAVIEIILKLEQAGARVIGIACNTCHVSEIFDVVLEELDKLQSTVKVVNMPEETCRYLKHFYPKVRRIGLMATNGTYRSGLYEKLLLRHGYQAILPAPDFQDSIIHRLVYDPEFGLKANPHRVTPMAIALMKQAVEYFRNRSAEAIILGCTELPLIPRERVEAGDIILVDSLESLALGLIRECCKKNKAAVMSQGDIY